MSIEVFRFATIRQPSTIIAPAALNSLAFEIKAESPFINEVRRYRAAAARNKLIEIVQSYIASSEYVGLGANIDPQLIKLAERLSLLNSLAFASNARASAEAIDLELDGLATADWFKVAQGRIGDSIVAASIDYSVSSPQRAQLVRLAGTLTVARAIAENLRFAIEDYQQPTLILPQGIFPLPRGTKSADDQRSQSKEIETKRAERDRALKEVAALREAVDDVVSALRRGEIAISAPKRSRGQVQPVRSPGFVLNTGEGSKLSKQAKSALRGVGLSGNVDATLAISLLEDKIAARSASLNEPRPVARMIRVGGDVVSSDLLSPDNRVFTEYAGRHPGPCPAPNIPPAAKSGPVTVPAGHGDAKMLGIMDLMIVEQRLARYELGEIAHIENVLRGETRVRSNRLTTTTEETITIETEESEDTQKDLSTTERFELQSEAQQVLTENASKQAGLSISASYGPTVDATATANASSTSSRQLSTQVASSFARETTARAVSRIQKRRFERRSTKTTREFVERNLHRFENSTSDISGTYRFVDKVYTAQVVNYGKRLILEFIVPEPSAFWRHALANQPVTPTSVVCPIEPGYCHESDGTFHPLQPQDVTAETYLFWAAQYGADSIQPPPATTRIVSSIKKGPDPIQALSTEDQRKVSSENAEIDIPDGYNPVKAIVNAYGETQAGVHKLIIQVQDQQFEYKEPWDDLVDLPLHQEATSKIPVSINSLRFHNYEVLFTIFCVVRQDKIWDWQFKTFSAIMDAYETVKGRYSAAIEAAQVSASYVPDFGRNPAQNRAIETTELKRACITLLSGQHFETFDAMSGASGQHGYPEINLAEAKAEARFVKLFEHGLDWANMTYVYYPYFWTRKDQWIRLAQITDQDPQFEQFLRAGSVRVQVPVRVGFERTIKNYDAGVEIWDSEGDLINFEEHDTGPQLTMLDELKSRLSNEYVEGDGAIEVTHDDATINGHETHFNETENRRRIRIGVTEYVIEAVDVEQQVIRLDRPYEGATNQSAGYALGPRLVGEPWEVRVPTNLVKLDDFPVS